MYPEGVSVITDWNGGNFLPIISGWIISRFFLWKIHTFRTHLSTHSENHYQFWKIRLLEYLANWSLKLILQRMEENSNFFYHVTFVTDNNKSVISEYRSQTDLNQYKLIDQ